MKKAKLKRKVDAENTAIARSVAKMLRQKGILCVNFMGSPGSGKTTLIESLASLLGPETIAVIQGDLESDIDKRRLEQQGISTHQINTHSGCHLNASMVEHALRRLSLGHRQFLFIENVGNLVCPAGRKIGQHINVLVSSTTEGSDKPEKYPIIFADSQVVVISKYDIAAFVGFDEQGYTSAVRKVTSARIIPTTNEASSALPLASFLQEQRARKIRLADAD